ncbi:class I SAM-dependent methyltransferase [Gloeocapsa sp. PCC 73106]|uniref:class I SAM-dependent methyltransferase n=1 Tax=Gloeocapsa sp. PCC 73106 TaxID=102232 RepID=UPI0002AC9FDF|nr:class I SAM-dependent methyltransferase [Gloeocapsa sp. PCC 73106]ELR97216.1 methyltransferase, cyclopropane fatty acid synthase [Gloeocapsa sp. PCC 73106]
MINPKRSTQLVLDSLLKGPLYGIVNHRIHSPVTLDAAENWNFWTEPKSPQVEWLFRKYPPESIRKKHLDFMLEQEHSKGIEAHYDVSNDFYALFLDTSYKFYSCAEFKSDNETLEQAQTNKAAHIFELLELDGNEKILDLGCGWGAMLKFLQNSGHKGELTGLTLSKEQFAYDRNQLGLNVFLTNFITETFENKPYDRIFSIGSFEHVKPKEINKIYQKIYDALTPEGLAVHQFFSLERESYPVSMVMTQLFFSGSVLVTHDVHIKAAQSAGFTISHDSIHDYKPTLRKWYENLVKNQERALDLVGLETYNRYITFFPIAWLFFQQGEAQVHRIVTKKSRHY